MFEPVRSSLLDTFLGVDDAGVAAAISVGAREENMACARRLEAMGELYARRAPDDGDERFCWLVDGYESLAAEVACELGVSSGRARGQLRYAMALREKLPRLMAVFLTGVIDLRMVIAIVNRVELVADAAVMAQVDAALARWAPTWMKLSGPKLEARIDWWVERVDPAGRRRPHERPEDRHVVFMPAPGGLEAMCARVRATDGAAIDARLDVLADTVCANDPRTKDQRRADALGAVAAGLEALRCECGLQDCTASKRPTGSQVVIHVLAEQATVDKTGTTPGWVPGRGVLPAHTVAELATDATIKPLLLPGPDRAPEPGYRPSAGLAAFVRARDMTCRFPGCDKPAAVCDIDHTVAWPAGPTHPSNLKLYCRLHHLLKTFWTGVGGWSEQQFPDGTITWTSPSGRCHTTQPGGALFFPQLARPTGELTLDKPAAAATERGVMMPRRRKTRKQERDERIQAERRLNEQLIKRQRWLFAELEQRRRQRLCDDPPPF